MSDAVQKKPFYRKKRFWIAVFLAFVAWCLYWTTNQSDEAIAYTFDSEWTPATSGGAVAPDFNCMQKSYPDSNYCAMFATTAYGGGELDDGTYDIRPSLASIGATSEAAAASYCPRRKQIGHTRRFRTGWLKKANVAWYHATYKWCYNGVRITKGPSFGPPYYTPGAIYTDAARAGWKIRLFSKRQACNAYNGYACHNVLASWMWKAEFQPVRLGLTLDTAYLCISIRVYGDGHHRRNGTCGGIPRG